MGRGPVYNWNAQTFSTQMGKYNLHTEIERGRLGVIGGVASKSTFNCAVRQTIHYQTTHTGNQGQYIEKKVSPALRREGGMGGKGRGGRERREGEREGRGGREGGREGEYKYI